MITIEVLTRLRAADPWSFTVLDTLRRKTGLEAIVAVVRLKSWRLDFRRSSADEALGTIRRLLAETALLANPNRDAWSIRGTRAGRRADAIWRASEETLDTFAVRVSDSEDLVGKSLLNVLTKRLGLVDVAEVRYSCVWVLEMGTRGPESRTIADGVAVTRSWRKGLLSNPHFQEAEVMKAEDFLAEGGVR